MYKITAQHGDLASGVWDGEMFNHNYPIVVHCESQNEAEEIAALLQSRYGDD